MSKYILSLLFLGWFSLTGHSQNHAYRQYTTDDGLPTNYVYGVIEDDEGYIWAYTENGIAKFDGTHFHNFTIADGLPSNDVYQMAKDDSTGLLWMSSAARIPAYVEKDTIITLNHLKPTNHFFLKHQGKIKYAGGSYFFVKNRDLVIDSILLPEQIYPLLPKKNQKGGSISPSYQKNELIYGREFGVTDYSLFKFDFKTRTYQEYSLFSRSNRFLPLRYIEGIYELAYPFYLAGTKKDLYIFNFATEQTLVYNWKAIIDQPIKHLSLDFPDDKNLIVSTDKYIVFFNENLHLKQVFYPKNISKQYTLLRFFEDSQGNYWQGTREGGLFFINKEELKTSHIQPENSRDQVIEKLLWNNGKIYAVSDNFKIYQLTSENELELFYQHPQQPLFNDVIIRQNGDMLFVGGGDTDPIIVLNQQEQPIGSPAEYPALKELLKRDSFLDVALNNAKKINLNEKYQQLFFFSHHGLIMYDMLQSTIEQLSTIRHGWSIHTDTFTHITYFANQAGIYSFREGQLKQDLETVGNVTMLWAKDAQYLWLGTRNQGLLEWNRQTNEVRQISKRKYIATVWKDKGQYLLGTKEGVVVLQEKKGTYHEVYCYNKKDGLLTAEILDVIADSQFIYAATIKGIMKIKKESEPLLVKDSLQRLSIQRIEVNGTSLPKAELGQLRYEQNKVIIDYYLLDFASKGHIQYEYKLAPIQQDWVKTDAKQVRFDDLRPQDYTFYLKATDWYGNEYILKEPLVFCIQKAFWQTWWFRFLCLALLLSAIVFFIKRREDQHQIKMAHEKSLNQKIGDLQLQSLRGQMNPHFIFNALGSIQYFIQTHNMDEADNYLTMFARLMRRYLDSATERNVDLATELAMLKEYTNLEMMRFEGLFSTSIQISENIELEEETIPSMMLQPFVENAINHGLQLRKTKDGQLIIACTKNKEGALIFTITDNGIGRVNAAKYRKESHISRGMENVYQRIETLRANELSDTTIHIEDLYPDEETYPGTKVELTFKKMTNDDL